MPALKSYGDFYNDSTARKLEKNETYTRKSYRKANENRRYGKNKLKQNARKRARKNVKLVACILCSFTMGMLITYRYNLISEKNLQTQELKSDLAAVEANLLNKQIEVEQSTDLNKIEAYAKQQLGMQKPDKNQTVYVDTSKSMNPIEINKEVSVIENIIEKIKDYISKIF